MAKIGFLLTFVFVVLAVASAIVPLQPQESCGFNDGAITKLKRCQYNCIDCDLTNDFISQNWRVKMDNG